MLDYFVCTYMYKLKTDNKFVWDLLVQCVTFRNAFKLCKKSNYVTFISLENHSVVGLYDYLLLCPALPVLVKRASMQCFVFQHFVLFWIFIEI